MNKLPEHFSKKVNFEVTPLLKEEQKQNPPKYVRFDINHDKSGSYGLDLERSFNPITSQKQTEKYTNYYKNRTYHYSHKLSKYEKLKIFGIHFKVSLDIFKKATKKALESFDEVVQALVLKRVINLKKQKELTLEKEQKKKEKHDKSYNARKMFAIGILNYPYISTHNHHAQDLESEKKKEIEHGK